MTLLAMYVHHHPGAIDVGDRQTRSFEQPQPAGINRRQTHAVDRNPHGREHAAHLVTTQHHRQLVFAGRADEPERCPLPVQRLFEEKPNPA
jgi:hypothetical protein